MTAAAGPAAPAPSISRRLTRSLAALSLAWAAAVSAVVWLVVQHEVDDLLDHTLQESAEILYGVLRYERGLLPLGQRGAMPAPPHHEQLVWQLLGPQSDLLLRSHQAPERPLAVAGARGLSSVGDAWRVYALPFDDTRTLVVAQRAPVRHQARVGAAAVTMAAALAVGLVFAAVMRRRAREELRPLRDLSAAVAAFDPLLPGASLADAPREELRPLQQAVLGLGRRLAVRLASERAFAAHAAHALRTPLAGLVTQLAVAQREAPGALQPRLQQARDAADRLRRVVSALLTMFRTGADLRWQNVDLSLLLRHLPVDGVATVADARSPLLADPDLLAAALMNLLDNARRLGASTVTVSTEPGAGGAPGVVVAVVDDGPGLPAERRDALQHALDEQDYEGRMGMGLMLADLVSRAHGGRLHIGTAGPGCRIELHLGAPDASLSTPPVGGQGPRPAGTGPDPGRQG